MLLVESTGTINHSVMIVGRCNWFPRLPCIERIGGHMPEGIISVLAEDYRFEPYLGYDEKHGGYVLK